MNFHTVPYEAHPGFGIIFPTKTIIIEEENQIVTISPCDLSLEETDRLTNSGKKLIFIAPNSFHNLHIATMKRKFPNAEFFGPKRAALMSKVNLKRTSTFQSTDIECYSIEGVKNLAETCFYHRPSKTLFVTDIFFNMNHKMNLASRVAFTIVGVYHKLATSKAVKLSIKDKSKFTDSLKKLSSLEIEKVIPSHGDSINKQEFDAWVNSF